MPEDNKISELPEISKEDLAITEREVTAPARKLYPKEEANLGLATTGQIIDELRARCEINGTIHYRTVDEIDEIRDSELEQARKSKVLLARAKPLLDELRKAGEKDPHKRGHY